MIGEIQAGKAPPMLAMRGDPPLQTAILEVLLNAIIGDQANPVTVIAAQ